MWILLVRAAGRKELYVYESESESESEPDWDYVPPER